jgi:cell division protein FtsB
MVGKRRLWLRARARFALAVLAVSLSAPVSVLAADPPLAPLDRLSDTLGDLQSRLAAIRESLEGMRSTSDAVTSSPSEPACAPPGEASPAPAAADELERLRTERAALQGRVAELEKAIKDARTGEVVAALVKRPSASPIETAAAAELAVPPQGGSALQASAPAETAETVAGDAPTANGGGANLQLRAQLALAQLKITGLSQELQSSRANQEALEAELSSLRLLTDAKIKEFMGWR